MDKNLDAIRQKNIEKKELSLKKLAEKSKNKERKNFLTIKKHDEFSKKYNKIRSSKLEKRKLSYIEKKSALIKSNRKLIGSKKQLFLEKTNLLLKKYEDQISKLKDDNKIKYTEEKIGDLKKNGYEIHRNKRKILYKYLNFRKKIIENKFEKKLSKLKYKFDVAIIDQKTYDTMLNDLYINKSLITTRIVNQIKKVETKTFDSQVMKEEKKLIAKKEVEILNINKRIKSLPPSTQLKKVKDKWEDLKSYSIFGDTIKNSIGKIGNNFRKFSMYYILIFVMVIFAIWTKGENLKPRQFATILNGNSYILIIGMGMLLVIVAGYIDLSVGSLMGFMGALSVQIFNQTGSIFATLMLIVLIGALIGFAQGVLIGYFKMPAFIVTLGAMLLFQGLILSLTKSETLIPDTDQFKKFVTGGFNDIMIGDFHLFAFIIIFGVGLVSTLLILHSRLNKGKYGIATSSWYTFIVKIAIMLAMFALIGYWIANSVFGLQYYLIYILILLVVFIFITQNTSLGRKIYAIGGNKKAATLSGINSARVTTYVFMIVGSLVGFAGIIFTGIATSASPTVSTQGYELDVIASVFVGGTSMQGGIGSIQGAFIGGLILGYINNGMLVVGLDVSMQKIIKALVLVGAVGYDIYANRKLG